MSTIDPKTEAYLRLRPSAEKASNMVVLLGFDAAYFLDELLECNDVEALRDLLIILPLQNVVGDAMEKNKLAQSLVKRRLHKLENPGT
jgi:hypothetical protein